MDLNCTEFIQALGNLQPADDDCSLESTLYDLVETIEKSEDPTPVFPYIFKFIEKYPEAEFGSPGALVHFAEQYPVYEQFLFESLRIKPTYLTLWMLNRILNAEPEGSRRDELMALLKNSITHPEAGSLAKSEADDFYQFQNEK